MARVDSRDKIPAGVLGYQLQVIKRDIRPDDIENSDIR